MSDQSAPPRPRTPDDLPFKPQPMVGWFNPAQLLRIGLQTSRTAGVISLVDEREIQSVTAPPSVHDYSALGTLWIDYVADLGDGFDSSYTVAYALAQDALGAGGATDVVFADGNAPGETLPRGGVLVMGGDEVYPSASVDNYDNRLEGPYRAALPFSNAPPDVYAIPGNHDWYDGLVSFRTRFCQPRWLGGWKTKQSRSYFSLKLPHGWWLWGTDVQLERDIDAPQKAFFENESKKLVAGDRVILCTAEPSWVQAAFGRRKPYEALSFLERHCITERGATLALTLTGDRHNYTRYSAADGSGRHRLIAGGGGAFLSGTHDLPDTITLPVGDRKTETLRLAKAYPSKAESRRLTWRTLGFVWWSRWFGALLAVLYMVYGWLIQSASRRDLLVWPNQMWPDLHPIPVDSLHAWLGRAGTSFMTTAASQSLGDTARAYATVLIRSPAVALYTLLIIAMLIALALASRRKQDGSSAPVAFVWGAAHALTHLWVGLLLIVVMARINFRLSLPLTSLRFQALLGLEMALFGTIAGALIMAAYFIASNLISGLHDQEVFSGQANPHFKNFLRMKIDAQGKLTVYPIGIDRSKSWVLAPEKPGASPWFKSADGKPLEVRLIDEPIVIG